MVLLAFIQLSPTIDTVLSVGASVVVAAAVNWAVSTRASAKFEGAVGATLKVHGEDLQRLDSVDKDQWGKINANSNDIAAMKARCDERHPKGRAAAAGH
jgi:hypothetical protein